MLELFRNKQKTGEHALEFFHEISHFKRRIGSKNGAGKESDSPACGFENADTTSIKPTNHIVEVNLTDYLPSPITLIYDFLSLGPIGKVAL